MWVPWRRRPETPPPEVEGGPEPPSWTTPEARLERELRTLEVAYALHTISRERYEDARRRILARHERASGDG